MAPRLLGWTRPSGPNDAAIRQAAWVARCVGRGDTAPLTADAVTALAITLRHHQVEPDTVVFRSGEPATDVWILQRGRLELSVGSGRRALSCRCCIRAMSTATSSS